MFDEGSLVFCHSFLTWISFNISAGKDFEICLFEGVYVLDSMAD